MQVLLHVDLTKQKKPQNVQDFEQKKNLSSVYSAIHIYFVKLIYQQNELSYWIMKSDG